MKGPFAKWPVKKRTQAFFPVAAVVALVAFFVVGLVTNVFLLALLAAPVLGLGAAYALLGRPQLTTPGAEPWIEPKLRPWMSIPTALLVGFVLYLVLGLLVTAIPLVPIDLATYLALALAAVGGVAAGVLAFGLPPVARAPREAWERVPHERRPLAFFPVGLVLTALLYYGLGVALTAYGTDSTPQALVALPVALLAGFALAGVLVGVPKPKRKVGEVLPPISARARPLLAVATVVLLAPAFAVALGPFASTLPLPGVLDLYVGLAGGLVLASAVAFLVWGGPARWSRHGEWRPDGLGPLRIALLVPVALVAGAVALFALDAATLPFPAALGAAVVVGLVTGLAAAGALGRVAHAPRAVREMPEVLKPLLFLATWAVAGGLAWILVASLPLPHALWGVGLAVGTGFLAALATVEGPLVARWWAERAGSLRERRALRAERAARLGARAVEPSRSIAPAAPSPGQAVKRRLFGRR